MGAETVVHKGIKYGVQSSGRYFQSFRKDVPERLLHRVVWVEHHGSIPAGHVVHHRDDDWRNNEIGNLGLLPRGKHQSEHMLRLLRGPSARLRNARALDLARIEAAKWHGSPAGVQWHREHGRATWRGRVKARSKTPCTHCGGPIESYFVSRTRFCSHRCGHNAAYFRNKTAGGNCALCGKGFVFNKYRKQECCSRLCSNRLHFRKRHGLQSDPRP